MRGQVVVCRNFMGDALVRLVWEDSMELVFIHSEDQYEAHSKGHPFLEPVGFPREDVFLASGDAVQASEPWQKLIPYSPQDEPNLDQLRGATAHPNKKGDPLSETP